MSRDRFFKKTNIPKINQKSPNSILSFDGFHISYNRSSRDYGCDTTAIVVKGNLFLILNGDHKDELANCAESDGLTGTINYFIDNLNYANSRSEHNNIAGLLEDPVDLKNFALKNIGEDLTKRLITATKNLSQKENLK